MPHLIPRQLVPKFSVPLLDGGSFELAAQQPEYFTLIVVYRGLHCPVCRGYMKELAGMQTELTGLGVTTLGVSADNKERAQQAYKEWELDGLTLGYGLPIGMARTWGLFISKKKEGSNPGVGEPDLFTEPGVFLVRPEGTLYASVINSMPFARPHLKDLLSGVSFIIGNDYPARGEA